VLPEFEERFLLKNLDANTIDTEHTEHKFNFQLDRHTFQHEADSKLQ